MPVLKYGLTPAWVSRIWPRLEQCAPPPSSSTAYTRGDAKWPRIETVPEAAGFGLLNVDSGLTLMGVRFRVSTRDLRRYSLSFQFAFRAAWRRRSCVGNRCRSHSC